MKRKRKSEFARFAKEDMKILLMLFLVGFLFFLYVMMRGKSMVYIQISAVIVVLSLVTFYLTSKINADKYLIIWTSVLLHCGSMLQAMSCTPEELHYELLKFAIAFIIAIAAGVFFRYCSFVLGTDLGMYAMMFVHFLIFAMLLVFGSTVEGYQSARVNLSIAGFTIQPLEIAKITYVFVMVSLLCKEDCKDKKVFGYLPREWASVCFTGLTAFFMILCSELGSLLVIGLAGMTLYLVYARKRKIIKYLALLGGCMASFLGLIVIWFHDKSSILEKIYLRFMYVATPEMDAAGAGYQYLQMKKAIAIGGIFGPDSTRYITRLTNEANDLVFCKLIQVCGIAIGILMIGAFILLFREGNKVAALAKDTYYGGLAHGFSYIIIYEAIIHISYSVGIFPITGIPLYFMSKGFASMTMGLIMVAFFIVISTGTQERSSYDEKTLGDLKELWNARRRKSFR